MRVPRRGRRRGLSRANALDEPPLPPTLEIDNGFNAGHESLRVALMVRTRKEERQDKPPAGPTFVSESAHLSVELWAPFAGVSVGPPPSRGEVRCPACRARSSPEA